MRYGSRQALSGLTLAVEAGGYVGVLGANGSGKTTLFKIIAGLINAHGGMAEVCGAPLGVETRRLTAYLPSQPFLPRRARLGGCIADCALFYPDFSPDAARALLKDLRLSEDLRVNQLS